MISLIFIIVYVDLSEIPNLKYTCLDNVDAWAVYRQRNRKKLHTRQGEWPLWLNEHALVRVPRNWDNEYRSISEGRA